MDFDFYNLSPAKMIKMQLLYLFSLRIHAFLVYAFYSRRWVKAHSPVILLFKMENKSAQKYEKIEPKQQQAKHQRRPNMFLQIESPLYCNFYIKPSFYVFFRIRIVLKRTNTLSDGEIDLKSRNKELQFHIFKKL